MELQPAVKFSAQLSQIPRFLLVLCWSQAGAVAAVGCHPWLSNVLFAVVKIHVGPWLVSSGFGFSVWLGLYVRARLGSWSSSLWSPKEPTGQWNLVSSMMWYGHENKLKGWKRKGACEIFQVHLSAKRCCQAIPQHWYFQDTVLKDVFSFLIVCIESLNRAVGDGVNSGLVMTKTSWRTMECCDLRFKISEVRKYHS